jgi:class 3 adenylate cyclase/tetratricopeptide (TPR) repeat protein
VTSGAGDATQVVCERCGEVNPSHARFCHSCGARFDAATEAREERKLVSVLFVDLAGFTASSDRADPEDVRDLLERYHASAKECIEQFGGAVEKFIGDAVMAVFGVPVSHGDDAERAVKAGLRALERIASLGLAARAAVNTGEAVVRVGDLSAGDPLALGDVVNTASRLQAAAPTGRLLVGGATFRATREVVVYEPSAAVTAKGKAEPVEAWLAVGVRPDSIDLPALVGPFVGRERELDAITSVWRQAVADARPHLLTLLGGPGVGKSRLCREVAAVVQGDGGRVLRGRCLPYEEQTGYQAFGQIVRQVTGIFDSDAPALARAKLDELARSHFTPDEVGERITDLSLLLGLGADYHVSQQRFLFFSARRLVELVGVEQPVLVVFEDVHWGTPSELDLVEYLSAHVRETRAVFVALARPEFLDLRPGWGGASPQTRIPIDPLPEELAAELAALRLPDGAGRSEVVRVVEVAEGNPLFIEELAAALAEGRAVEELPVTVWAAIAARIDSLPEDSRTALLSAAVVGRTFWQDVLQAVADLVDVQASLDDLERRDLIRRDPTSRLEGDVEYRFKHALIRDVAYGTLPRATRRERHAAIARFIESRTDGAETVAWILAHHWREAGEAEKAVPHLLAAAEIAQNAWATDAAVNLYSAAIDSVSGDASRARIRLHRAMALVTLQEYERALDDLLEVLPALAGADLLDGLLYGGRAHLWSEQHEEALSLAEHAMQVAEALGDPDAGVAATALLSQAYAARGDDGDIDRAIQLGDDALGGWRKGRRPYEHAEHLHLHADLMYWTGNYERTMELGAAAQELGGEVVNPEVIVRGSGIRAVAVAGLGRHEEALARFDAIAKLAEELGHGRSLVLLNYSSIVHRELLDLQTARELSEEAYELLRGSSFGMPRRFAQSDLLFTSLLAGEVGDAEAAWPALWEDAHNATGWTRWLILGRLATAKAEIALRTGDPEAEEWGGRAVEISARTRRRKYEARARSLLGQATIASGRVAEGLGELRAAVDIADALVNPPGRWAARADLTRALYETGHDDEASRVHGEAVEIVDGFAATLAPGRASVLLDAPVIRAILRP